MGRKKVFIGIVIAFALLVIAIAAMFVSSGSEQRPVSFQAATQSQRPATTTLQIMLEGMEENMAATLYVGEGYSIYIPDDWTLQSTSAQNSADCWTLDINPNLSFQIVQRNEVSAEQMLQQLMQERGITTPLQPLENGSFVIIQNVQTIVFQLLGEKDNNSYYLIGQYPSEATEGFGARLYAAADTFMLE